MNPQERKCDDLLLTGGHIIDPTNGMNGPADLAVKDGLIAAVGSLEPDSAAKVVDGHGALRDAGTD